MNKRLWVLPVLAAILVASSGVGYAIPSLGGPTGVVAMPNALAAPMGNLQLAGSYQDVSADSDFSADLDLVNGLEDFGVFSLQALAGVAEGAELWAAYSRDNSDFDFATWGIGGKYVIPTETTAGTSLAIGASYRASNGDADLLTNTANPVLAAFSLDATVTDVYAVVTQDFASMAGSEWCPGAKLLGSLGVLWKNLDADLDTTIGAVTVSESGDDSFFRPFVTVQWISADNVYLGLEYRWKDSDLDDDPVFSAVLGGTFAGNWTGEAGTTNADQIGLGGDDQNWFARLGYTFGLGGTW
jgi:hypothetical protein